MRFTKPLVAFCCLVLIASGLLAVPVEPQTSSLRARGPVVHVSDGFESGNFSAWTGTQSFGCADSPGQPTVTTTRPYSGTYSMQTHFIIQANPPGSCGASTDQDIFVQQNSAVACRGVCAEGWVYLKTPEAGACHPCAIQRKLIRILDHATYETATHGAGLTCDGDPASARCGARIFTDRGPPTISFYGGWGDQASDPAAYNGIFSFLFDTWYKVKFCVRGKSADGAADPKLLLVVNGVTKFSKTTGYQSPNCNGDVTKGPCDPFPADGETANGLDHIRIGEQVNRVAAGSAVDEFRYHDDWRFSCWNE